MIFRRRPGPAWAVAFLAAGLVGPLVPRTPAVEILVPQDQPTIQAAVNAARANDTVIVSNGVYREMVSVPATKTNLVIRGMSNTETRLIGGFYLSVVGVVVENMRIVGGGVIGGWPNPNAFSIGGGTNVTIRNNILENYYGRAWEITYNVHFLTIESNRVRNALYAGYINGCSNVVVRGNYFEGPSTIALAWDRMYDFLLDRNTVVYSTGPSLTPQNDWFVVSSNNFVLTPDGVPALVFGTNDAWTVHAADNWWGSSNGPYDPLGTVEVAPGDAHPGVAALWNAQPSNQLGALLAEYKGGAVTAGTDHLDYFPWALAPVDTGWEVPTATVAWVSRDYGPTNANDGHTWGIDAFDNVQDAVNGVWSGTVRVAAGTYAFTDPLFVCKAVRVEGIEGAERTVLRMDLPRWTNRVVFLNHAGAVLSGFTVTGGRTGPSTYAPHKNGAGAYIFRGTVESCIISNNIAWDQGGGVWMQNGARLRNCLVAQNTATNTGGGVYVNTSSGVVENCTIVDNRALTGGGLAANGGRAFIQNSVLTYNTASTGPNVATPGASGFVSGGGVEYCLSADDLSAWGAGNVRGLPWFKGRGAGDYRLHASSAAVNAGTNAAWAAAAGAADLDGRERMLFGRVDMGAYECPDLPGGLFFVR